MNKAAIYICVLIYSPMERGKDDVTHIKGSHFMNGSMNGFTSSNFPWMKKKRVCVYKYKALEKHCGIPPRF